MPEKPALEIRKSIPDNKGQYAPGESFTFRIEYRNKMDGSLAENTVLADHFDRAYFDIVSPTNLNLTDNTWRQPIGNLAYSAAFHVIDIRVQVKQEVSNQQRICNTAELSAINAPPVSSTVCTDTVVPPKTEVTPGRHKTVMNITQNLSGEAALAKPVRPGDVIEYSIMTTNSGSVDKLHYVIEDYIGDILDYADLDEAYLASQGGTYNAETRKVVWQNQTLKAGSDTVKTFRVKLKDPVPSTNAPSALTTSFDCKISNQYGNETSMDVVCPLVKNIERLPNTGPGETLAVAFGVTTAAAYFFARSRLLAKELNIVRHEYAAGGEV